MKHLFILPLAACLLAAPSVAWAEDSSAAATPEAAATLTDAELAEQLAEAIQEILTTVADPAQQKEQIALLVAKSVKTHGARAAGIMAALTGKIGEAHLPILSAAAVMAAGNGSPQVLRAMMAARVNNQQAVAAVRQGATNPVGVLGTSVAAKVVPNPTQPASTTASTTIARTAPAPQVAAAGASAAEPEITGGGEPPPPPAIPPRPPALPYRGQ